MSIYILDLDPIKAANSLTIQHASNYIKRLKFSFTLAHLPTSRKPTYFSRVIPEVKYSKQNYVWFSEFYTELCKIVNPDNIIVDKFKPEFLYQCKNINFKNEDLKLDINEYNLTNEEIVLKHRLKYIRNCYPLRRFKNGYPSWYLKKDNLIFKRYNTRLRRDFKIEYYNGKYRYYIADYFNQWIEIEDVPEEIDGFINTLLFKD